MISTQKIKKGQLDGVIETIVAGTNVTINNTDPKNPIVSASGGGGGGVTPKIKTLTSANLVTQDIAGFLTYVNALSPNLVIASSELYDFSVTDTGQVFKLYKNGVTVGLGQVAIVAGDVLEVKETFLTDFGRFSFDSFVMANGNLGYINQHSAITSTTGTINYPTLGGSNWVGKRRLCNSYYSAGTTGSFSQVLSSASSMAVGNSNTIIEVFSASEHATAISTSRSFSGIRTVSSSIGNVDPSILLNIIGIGDDSADTNMHIMHNDNTGTCTKLDLGVNFPAKYNIGEHVYRAEMHNLIGSANWLVKVECTVTGVKTSRLITTNLPAAVNIQMYPVCFMGNGTTATVVKMLFFSWIFKNY